MRDFAKFAMKSILTFSWLDIGRWAKACLPFF